LDSRNIQNPLLDWSGFFVILMYMPKGVYAHVQRITDEEVIESARKYKTRNEWKHGEMRLYDCARRRKLMDQCCAHMTYIGSRRYYEWQVYAYEWPDRKEAYVGITSQPDKRHSNTSGHAYRGPVFDHTQLHGNPIFKVLHFPVVSDRAGAVEVASMEAYKANGWTLLNTATGGGMGTFDRLWTVPKVLEDAKKYQTRRAWALANRSAYNAAKRLGIQAEATAHMISPPKSGRWSSV